MSPDFQPFPKIGRLKRGCVVTEKIDGTNACIVIQNGEMFTQSRKRFIVPGDDNYGFAAWAQEHRDELLTMGEGRHFGEWWGAGIQRRYGLTEKRFSLFDVNRWQDGCAARPACCGVVPILYQGDFDMARINGAMMDLAIMGSSAAPGFMNPEGIVVFHTATGTLFKQTFENDAEGKDRAQARAA